MRELNIGTKRHTRVAAVDEPGAGGANHSYRIIKNDGKPFDDGARDVNDVLGEVLFQNGPVKAAGVNGIHNEDLIAIVIDRLDGFQSGEFACLDNAVAKKFLEEALATLRKRTNDREARGVEGTNEI